MSKPDTLTGISKAENGSGYAVMNGRGHKALPFKAAEKYRKLRENKLKAL